MKDEIIFICEFENTTQEISLKDTIYAVVVKDLPVSIRFKDTTKRHYRSDTSLYTNPHKAQNMVNKLNERYNTDLFEVKKLKHPFLFTD